MRFYLSILLLCLGQLSAGSFDLTGATVEEKVGQLLLVHVKGEEEAERLLRQAYVGGFIYYNWSNDLSSPYKVQKLSLSLQKLNRQMGIPIPLFIAVDQEGGSVNRLKEGFTQFPSASELASTQLFSLGERAAFATGKELMSVGINLITSPVVDVAGKTSLFKARTFSDNPAQVVKWGHVALTGYRGAGIIATLKHFPGHGDVQIDSHLATPVLNKPLEQLEKEDFYPFKKLTKQADAIMTGHLLVSALDPALPATLSPTLLNLLPRWGFKGVIISDSLVMKGLNSYGSSIEELALKALLAGCDLLCLGGKLLHTTDQEEITATDVIRIHAYLVEAVTKGLLTMERLDQSVQRILHLKQKYGLGQWEELKLLAPDELVSTPKHQQLKEEIALLTTLQKNLKPSICKEIGKKIWKNEGNQKVDNLICWNAGEECLSLGIGHFIWYPAHAKDQFNAAFPQYLAFLKNRGIPLPSCIDTHNLPWASREQFLAQKESDKVKELRDWLLQTIDLQTEFMVQRLTYSIDRILNQAQDDERSLLLERLNTLIQSPEGIFALIDYLNFKGEGLFPTEQYQGQGWGLYQVLLHMQGNTLPHFQQSALETLNQRVALAPPERNESRWLPGWKNRLNGYR